MYDEAGFGNGGEMKGEKAGDSKKKTCKKGMLVTPGGEW